MSNPFAQTAPVALLPDDAAYAALAAAAIAPVRAAADDRVRVRIERMDTLGTWAFVQGRLEAPDGSRPDYAGTTFAERAAQGGMSDLHVALLRHKGDAWVLVDHAIGPADVAWLTWPTKHAAPRQLFGF
ncbi:hypothetical protein E5843_11880 [Luteimonas yindakuii]|uniref:hypothetical protein n=1 Tax=Luteimonas yindakuii TaxID=2565782 RepID=UPI0010A4FFA8|nr:hypothetical protein [Luteimonas yindakuii]QCO68288.1 hypothetical protein E5843_11880 [Luteimonas yindakuii]